MKPLKIWITVGSLIVMIIGAWYGLYPLYMQVDDILYETVGQDLTGEAKVVYDYNRAFLTKLFTLSGVIFVLTVLYWGWTSMQARETISGRYGARYV